MKRTILDYTLKIRLPLTIFVVALSFIITFYISRHERDNIGYSPEQPIKFSHQLHTGQMAIDCQYCHLGVTKGRHATIPSASICMNCHSITRKDKPEIIKLTHYYEAGIPIPWKRVHKIPEYSYFNHSVHINKGIECESCHGNVKEMTVIKQIKPFTMGDCLECHRNPQAQISYIKISNKGPEYCWACHR